MENKFVYLKELDGKDVLYFDLGDKIIKTINLNEKDQSSLRELFYLIIKQILKEDFEFVLQVDESYKKSLYKEIAAEYIKQLNIELKQIKSSVPEELKQKRE